MRNQELSKQLIEWRHFLHENAETAFEEVNTAKFVKRKIKGNGL